MSKEYRAAFVFHLILANIDPSIHYFNVHITKMNMGAKRAIYLGLHRDISAVFGY